MSINVSLDSYPFLELISIFANSKESGRLQLDFKCGQGSFYFDKGELVAAQVGPLTGFSAVNVALSMEGTGKRFDPDAELIPTQFSESNERLLLNRLLGMQTVVHCTGHSLANGSLADSESLTFEPTAEAVVSPALSVPSIVTPATSTPMLESSTMVPPAPKTVPRRPLALVIPAMPERFRNAVELPLHFLANTVTQSETNGQTHKLILRAASILLFGILTATGIIIFRHTANSPASPPMPFQSPAKVTPEKTADSSSSDKSGPIRPSTKASRRDSAEALTRESKQSSTSKDSHSSPATANGDPHSSTATANGDPHSSPATAKVPEVMKATPSQPVEKETLKENTRTARDSVREISVVVKFENGHVVEAYVKNRQPASEAYEATALRLARQRRYPVDAAGTKTLVFRVANEQ